MSAVSLYSVGEDGSSFNGVTYVGNNSASKEDSVFFFSMKSDNGGKKYENISENNILGVVTQIDMTKGENVSITPTIGSSLYMFVGGESVWDITVGGLAFVSCKAKKQHGFNNAVDWYLENNVAKTGKAISITIGKQNFKGYLVAFRTQVVAKASDISTFSFRFYAVKSK